MSSIEDKLTIANNGVPKVYDAGGVCTMTRDTYSTNKTYYGTIDKPVANVWIKPNTTVTDLLFTFVISDHSLNSRNVSISGTFEAGVEASVDVDINTFDGDTVATCTSYTDSGVEYVPFKLVPTVKKEYLGKNKPYIDTSKITNFSNFFYNNRCIDMIDLIDTSNGTSFYEAFSHSSSLTSLPSLNVSKGTNFRLMFNYVSYLKTVGVLDTSKGTTMMEMFNMCTDLVTIKGINVSKCNKLDDIFYGCRSLENITFNDSIIASISFSTSPKLTIDSLHSIINSLTVNTGSNTKKLTLNSASWTKLESDTPPDGYATWKEYITNYKNWTYA